MRKCATARDVAYTVKLVDELNPYRWNIVSLQHMQHKVSQMAVCRLSVLISVQ